MTKLSTHYSFQKTAQYGNQSQCKIEVGDHGTRMFSICVQAQPDMQEHVLMTSKMLDNISCKRKSNRWPMAVFSNMIDISALNALIICNDVNPNWQKDKNTKRRVFLRELALSLAKPYMAARKGMPRTESAASMLLAVSRESLNDSMGWRESSLARSTPSTMSRESSLSRGSSPALEIPQKKGKIVPPNVSGKARCHICYKEKSKNKNNTNETMCCFCEKGVCVNCVADKLL